MCTPQGTIAPPPEYRLFDTSTVGMVAFLCGPLAGAILIAMNYDNLGKTGKAVLAVVLGFLASLLIIVTRSNFNLSLGPLVSDALLILSIVCTWQIAKKLQGRAVIEHTARGGQLAASSTAFFIGIAVLGGSFGVIWIAAHI
jgi:hypothetical protein